MIKFFRTIRQKLLSDNKISKYLLYALGEIILVVIGILIALQINNQNQHRKDQNLAAIYKAALIQDLTLDLSHFDYHSSLSKEENQIIDSIRNLLNQPNADITTLKAIIKNGIEFNIKEDYIMLATTENPNISDNTFLSLQNSGQITLLENDLQEALGSFYGYHDKYRFMVQEIMANKNAIFFDYISTIPFSPGGDLNIVQSELNNRVWDKVDWNTVQIKFISLINTYYELNLKNIFFNDIRFEKTKIMIESLQEDIDQYYK